MRDHAEQIHQYIERTTGEIRTETFFRDQIVRTLYSRKNESGGHLMRMLTSAQISSLLGYLAYDLSLGAKLGGGNGFLKELGADLSECAEPLHRLDTPRKVFERKIRYWERRPMPEANDRIVSPSDAKVLTGSFREDSPLFIKEKFFDYHELIGSGKARWLKTFAGGDWALFRLTPEKYHYNHAPVSGLLVDFYEIEGNYAPCNPSAVMAAVSPYSRNRRVVSIIDTDTAGGTGAGLVAMIEIAALMIGQIVQCCSQREYEDPQPMQIGMFLERGQPKSLFRPGSSTVLLVFEKGRVLFSRDLEENRTRWGVKSRFTDGLGGRTLVETDVAVRSEIAAAL